MSYNALRLPHFTV